MTHDNQPWQEVAEECRRGISHARTLESFDSLLAYIKQLEHERDHWKQEANGLVSEQRLGEGYYVDAPPARARVEQLEGERDACREEKQIAVRSAALNAQEAERLREALEGCIQRGDDVDEGPWAAINPSGLQKALSALAARTEEPRSHPRSAEITRAYREQLDTRTEEQA